MEVLYGFIGINHGVLCDHITGQPDPAGFGLDCVWCQKERARYLVGMASGGSRLFCYAVSDPAPGAESAFGKTGICTVCG